MPNLFQIFNPSGNNMETDTDYGTDSYRINGIPSGTGNVAPTPKHNKMYRQWSTMVWAIAQVMSNRGQTASDGNPTALAAAVDAAFPLGAQIVTGMCIEYHSNYLLDGYLWANGLTIGNASSGASARANADTQALFGYYWQYYTDATNPMYSSGGILVARGTSAAADYAAGCRMTIVDKREVVTTGKSDMGGRSPRGILTTQTPNVANSQILGGMFGEPAHFQLPAELARHQHNLKTTLNRNGSGRGTGTTPPTAYNEADILTEFYPTNASDQVAFNVVQPSLSTNFMVKL